MSMISFFDSIWSVCNLFLPSRWAQRSPNDGRNSFYVFDVGYAWSAAINTGGPG